MARKKREFTPQERASREQRSLIGRLGGCAFLIYTVVQLIRIPRDEVPISETLQIIIIAVFIALAAVAVAFTAINTYRAWKRGDFNEQSYYTPEQLEELERLRLEEESGAAELSDVQALEEDDSIDEETEAEDS